MTNVRNFLMNLETEFSTVEDYKKAQQDIVTQLISVLPNQMVLHSLWGAGKIESVLREASDINRLVLSIDFDGNVKRIAFMSFAPKALQEVKLMVTLTFTDTDSGELCDKAFEINNILQTNCKVLEWDLKAKAAREAKEKEAQAKAKANFERQKANSIEAFNSMPDNKVDSQQSDEFYFALGWLAAHVGSVSARLPDYLESAFVNHFGPDAPYNAVDSTKRTSGGYAMQWTFGFTATLRKAENVPAILMPYMSDTGKAIANTAFIWTMVDDYGFQFGKKQNKSKIESCVPDVFKSSFIDGLNS